MPCFGSNVHRSLVPGSTDFVLEIALEFNSGNVFQLFLISYFRCNETSNPIPEKDATFIYFSSTGLLKLLQKRQHRTLGNCHSFSKPKKFKCATFLPSTNMVSLKEEKNNFLFQYKF